MRRFEVIDAECVGCNLCVSVCPVEDCISMVSIEGETDPRTGRPVHRRLRQLDDPPEQPVARGGGHRGGRVDAQRPSTDSRAACQRACFSASESEA